ncbi:uncharacterized protein LOC108465754 [Gossypium arboreum]|uniref:uncharacterized protein LOC108465754 n=1 Tax=Gossypium arboreum TaxID=29729 RepID=UPI000819082C|nr:uncharacterized protein LOC108465754 [Gossypium arboreum]
MGRGRGAPDRGSGHTKARQPTLVYAVHHRVDGDAPDVITDTLFIHNVPYNALIDVRSTHSYITCTVFETLGIIVETNASEVIVLSPLRQSVKVNKLFRDVPLEVQGTIFLADLMEPPFREFDSILGMDWLVEHQMNLNCATNGWY